MKKLPYKVLTLSTLVAIAITSNIVPIHVLAQEHVVQEVQQETKYNLSPQGIQEALRTTGSNALVMNMYSNALIQQKDFDLSSLSSPTDADLKNKIATDLHVARNHARDWLDQGQTQLQGTINGIIDYSMTFHEYHKGLMEALKDSKKVDTQAMVHILDMLTGDINDQQQKIEDVITYLRTFKNSLNEDVMEFNKNKNDIVAILEGKDGLLKSWQLQLDQEKQTRNQYFNNVMGWGIGGLGGTLILLAATVGGIVAIVVTGGTATPVVISGLALAGAAAAGLGTASAIMLSKQLDALNTSDQTIAKLNENLDSGRKVTAGLTTVSRDLVSTSSIIDSAIGSLSNMKNQWVSMKGKYISLSNSVKSGAIRSQDVSMVKAGLDTSLSNWGNIEKETQALLKDISYVPQIQEKNRDPEIQTSRLKMAHTY